MLEKKSYELSSHFTGGKDHPEDRIIVALDVEEPEARAIARSLKGKAQWLKVGMTLFYQAGPGIVSEFKDMGFKVFLDLKLHDIPHQVRGAARNAALAGADMLSVHALGGVDMLRAAKEGAAEASAITGEPCDLVAITVLTSHSQKTLESLGIEASVEQEVERLAGLVGEAGLEGIVCSPQEAAQMHQLLGDRALIVTPGVRPQGSGLQDQKRVCTPAEAFQAGSSHIVMGRPITQAPQPAQAFVHIVGTI